MTEAEHDVWAFAQAASQRLGGFVIACSVVVLLVAWSVVQWRRAAT